MQKIKSTTIDWESQRVLSQIAEQINQPLTDIRRLIKYLQTRNNEKDFETSRLSSIILESSEQIESLINDIVKVEQDKRIEILVHDKFRYPYLYNLDSNKVFSDRDLAKHIDGNVSKVKISKADIDWLKTLEYTVLENIDFYGLNVSWLAKQTAVSERQVFRKIEKYTGLTPNKYIRSLRLYKAKDLLEEYAFSSVNQVARAVGLKDPYYFSNLYKNQFGIKPKDYLV